MNDTTGAQNTGAKSDVITAAILVIGDEILSGRTKDKNIGYIAEYLTAVGIDLMEVRVVGDEEASIVILDISGKSSPSPLSNVWYRWVWVSTRPGKMSIPSASIVRRAA